MSLSARRASASFAPRNVRAHAGRQRRGSRCRDRRRPAPFDIAASVQIDDASQTAVALRTTKASRRRMASASAASSGSMRRIGTSGRAGSSRTARSSARASGPRAACASAHGALAASKRPAADKGDGVRSSMWQAHSAAALVLPQYQHGEMSVRSRRAAIFRRFRPNDPDIPLTVRMARTSRPVAMPTSQDPPISGSTRQRGEPKWVT